MTNQPNLFKAVLPILVLAALFVGCTSAPPARLPDGVAAVAAWNEMRERWHVGVIGEGDRDGSILRVLCITEAGVSFDLDHDRLLPGLNIDVSLAEDDGRGSLKGVWTIDGRSWNGEDWVRDQGHSPPSFVASSSENAQSLYDALRDAETASFTSLASIDYSPLITTTFDTGALFSTPLQPSLDECGLDGLNERFSSELATMYAYWIPDSERHSISLIDRDAATDHGLILSCGPKVMTDDDAPAWIREAEGDIYAAATLLGFSGESDHDHDQTDSSMVESVTVSWVDDDGNVGTAVWEANGSWIQPPSLRENLRFIDTLRTSDELTLTVEAADQEPVEMTLTGAALFAKPIGAELETCIREYADLNG